MEGQPFGNGLPGRNPHQPGTYTYPSSSRDDPPIYFFPAPAPFGHAHMRENHPLASQTTSGVQPTYVPSTYPVAAPYHNYLPSAAPPYPSQQVPSEAMPEGYGAYNNSGRNQFNHLGYPGEQANIGTQYQHNQYTNAPMHGNEHGIQNGLAGGSWVPPHLNPPPSFPHATADHHDHEGAARFSGGYGTVEEDDSEGDDSEEEGSENDEMEEENDEMEEDASEEDDTENDIGGPYLYCELCNHHGHVPFDCHLARWDEPNPEPAARDQIEEAALSEDQKKYQILAGKLSQIVWNLIPDSEQPPESHKTMMKHILRVLSDEPNNTEIVHNHMYGGEFQDKWLCLKAMCDPEYQGAVSLVDGRCRYCRNPRRSEVTLCYQIMPREGHMALYREVGIVRA